MTKKLDEIRYWTYNQEKQPAAIFIHGFTGSHEGFQYIISELPNYHIIVPDLPGFGETKLGIDEFTIDDIARRVNQFVRDLNHGTKLYLVSHSMGGLVAASMLADAPDLYEKKTVFVSPVATKVNYLDSRKIGELLGRLQFFVGKTVPKAGPKLVKSRLLSRIATSIILTASDRELKKTINAHHFKNLDYISSIDFYYQLHKDINKKGAIDYADSLKQFKLLLITGDKDNVTPFSTEKKLQKATNADMHVIKGVGHLLHYEEPTKVAAAIDAYLR